MHFWRAWASLSLLCRYMKVSKAENSGFVSLFIAYSFKVFTDNLYC